MKRLIFALSVVFAVFFSIEVFAQEFSADIVSSNRGGVYTARIFMGIDKNRVESEESIVISRMDKKVVWILMPAQKTYMEQSLDSGKVISTTEKIEGEVERTLLGKENVNGRSADKYKVTYELNGVESSMYQWIDPSLRLPVKTAAIDGSWTTEYRNIRSGHQPEDLFEIPAGYTKFDMPDMGNAMEGLMDDE